jgi:hypothetical protein
MSSHYVQLALVNSYFDFDDYETPIKTYLEDLNVISLIPDITKNFFYEIQENTAELKESLLFNVFSETKKFYSIGERAATVENFQRFQQSFTNIFIRLSQKSDMYERISFTIFDMFGIIGGIFGVLSAFGSISTSLISEKVLNNRILSKLYQMRMENNNTFASQNLIEDENLSKVAGSEINFEESKIEHKNFRSSENWNIGEYRHNEITMNVSSTRNDIIDTAKSPIQESHDSENSIPDRILFEVEKEMKSRRKYSYSYKNILYSFIRISN